MESMRQDEGFPGGGEISVIRRQAKALCLSHPGVGDAPGQPELADGDDHGPDELAGLIKKGFAHGGSVQQARPPGAVQIEGQEQAAFDAADVEHIAPVPGSGLDGGDEARNPGAGVKRAVLTARQQWLVEFGLDAERLAEVIVAHDEGLDRGGFGRRRVGAEGVIAKQLGDPFRRLDKARADEQGGEESVERGKAADRPRRGRVRQQVRQPGVRHRGRPFPRQTGRPRSARSRCWPAAAHAATAIGAVSSISAFILALASVSRAAFQFQGRSS